MPPPPASPTLPPLLPNTSPLVGYKGECGYRMQCWVVKRVAGGMFMFVHPECVCRRGKGHGGRDTQVWQTIHAHPYTSPPGEGIRLKQGGVG